MNSELTSCLVARALPTPPVEKSDLQLKRIGMADVKTQIATILLGIWTLVIFCTVVSMYSTWERKMLNSDNGREDQGTTEPLGRNFWIF